MCPAAGVDTVSGMDFLAAAKPSLMEQIGQVAVIATAVSAFVSIALVLLFRRLDQPEPDWVVTGKPQLTSREEAVAKSGAWIRGRLHNAGDGTAFQLTVDGDHCQAFLYEDMPRRPAGLNELPFIALVRPGEQQQISISCEREEWDRAAVVVTWIGSPTRRRKQRAHRMPVREIAPLPRPESW